jgi:hypothetical protein
MTRHLEHLDTARSAALMPGEPCVLDGQSGTCKACEVEQAIKRHRSHPAFCKVYARRTPMIPFHNGQTTYRVGTPDGPVTTVRQPCLGCGRVQP